MFNLTKISAFIFTLFIWLNSQAQIEFVENKGQWNEAVKYKGDFQNGAFFLEKNGFSVLLHNQDDWQKLAYYVHGHKDSVVNLNDKIILHSAVYRVSLLGSSENAQLKPEKITNSYNNYFVGNNPSKWASGCKIYQSVSYKNIYPNIDVRYYNEGENLKYDFIVYPGGDPSKILMQYDGAEKVYVQQKSLMIKTAVGAVKELYPYSYQTNPSGIRDAVTCNFSVHNNVVGFKLKDYDPSKILIIDPAIIFSSFTGSAVDNWGYTATPGPDGSFYAGGIAFGNGYLISTGAFQTTYVGGVMEGVLDGHDIAIFKFNSNGTNRVYATYLGGDGNEQPHSMIVDPGGNLIVAGRSFSNNYPTTIPQIGSGGNNDIVITKFNAAGTALIGSVKIGGSNNDGINIRSKYESPDGADRLRRNYGDDARSEVIIDKDNNIILAACTQSNNFPTIGASLNTNNAFGGGLQDGLILKFSPDLSTYLFGSFFGGSGDDACFVASINPITNNLCIAGGTTSNNLPGDKTGSLYPNFKGGIADGFVVQLATDYSSILKTTYVGTSGTDLIYGLKFDKLGYPYVMGTTTGNWPVINAAYSITNSSQFICKLKPDLSNFLYSTIFGNGTLAPNISPIGFMVDRCENVYVSGWGGGINVYKNYTTGNTSGLPLLNPLTSVGAPDGEDFYFFVLKRNAAALLFGSNFGQYKGNTGDHVDGGTSRFDENGIIYQALCANCNGGATFPTTSGAWRRINGSANCNEAAVKIEMNFAGVVSGIQSSINAVINDTAGCVPFRVDFRDTLIKAKRIYWDFGNGQKDTTNAPNFSTFTTYNAVGTYLVRIIAEDSSTCNIRDTSYLKIKAGNNKATLDFIAIKSLPCSSLNYTFTNLSSPTFGNFTPRSFVWNYGDGSAPDTSFNGQHLFPAIGIYSVTLTLIDNNFCNSPDKKTISLSVNPLVEAKLSTSPEGCAPYLASFQNQSTSTDVTWEFSDGTTTNVENPTKLFLTPGTYTVRIIARNPNTCNRIDTSDYFTIIVHDIPNASFTWQPNPPQTNTPTIFINQSSGAVSYLWNFGDGITAISPNPAHQYITTGSFNASLIATNQYGCKDTFSLTTLALIDPLLDVPNAFTPDKFGQNAVIKIKGFGIGKLDWKIYNRWGQMVFQSSDIYKGWDGYFKGKLQPMDVYAYTIDAYLTNGQKIRKTGDITLIR